MPRKPAPLDTEVIDIVKRLRRATVLSVAEIAGCDYGPTRRVLEELAENGDITKVMIGARKFAFEPAKKVAEPAPVVEPEQLDEPAGGSCVVADVCKDDNRVWTIRAEGRRRGEIAEVHFGPMVKYQVISPFSPDVFETFGEACDNLRQWG